MFVFTRRQPTWLTLGLDAAEAQAQPIRKHQVRAVEPMMLLHLLEKGKKITFRLLELTGGHISVTACLLVDGSLFIQASIGLATS